MENVHDLIIIGGGAAGLAAASYALGKQLDTLIIYDVLGGKAAQQLQIRMDEEEDMSLLGYPFPEERPVSTTKMAGEEMLRLFVQQVRASIGTALRDHVLKVSRLDSIYYVETRSNSVQHGRSVIVATGVAPRHLDVPGARAYLGMGLGYSATTHTRLVEGKRVAVIGTTVRALRGANELVQTASQIYLIIPDTSNLASPLIGTLREYAHVEVLENYQVQAVLGTSVVEQIVVGFQGSTRPLDVDVAFVDMGLEPNTAPLEKLEVLDDAGFIPVDGRNATTLPGLFAAGDVTTNVGEQVLIAIGEGARAAVSAYTYLLEQQAVKR